MDIEFVRKVWRYYIMVIGSRISGRTDNTMTKRKTIKRHPMVDKTLHLKL